MKATWLVLLICVGCKSDDPDRPTGPQTIGPAGGTVESDDGILRLDVPEGALGEDTVFEIVAVAQADWPSEVADRDPIGGNVYDVQPDGTVFAVPATLTWTYATAPTNAFEGGNPLLLFGASFGTAFEVNAATDTDLDTGLVTTSSIEHLSLQFLTGRLNRVFALTPTASIEADLLGGEHFVDTPWFARAIAAHPLDTVSVVVEAQNTGTLVVEPIKDPPWDKLLRRGDTGLVEGRQEWSLGIVESLSSMPRWVCTNTGAGTVGLTYFAEIDLQIVSSFVRAEASVKFSEPVTCVTREEKAEWLMHLATLANRFENLGTAASAIRDLATVQGLYGYIVHFDAIPGPPVGAQTLEVCVTSSGSTAVTYFPHFSPGFNFVDTTPGCTNITNPDPTLDNDVLVELSGTGNTTVTTQLLP